MDSRLLGIRFYGTLKTDFSHLKYVFSQKCRCAVLNSLVWFDCCSLSVVSTLCTVHDDHVFDHVFVLLPLLSSVEKSPGDNARSQRGDWPYEASSWSPLGSPPVVAQHKMPLDRPNFSAFRPQGCARAGFEELGLERRTPTLGL